MNELKLVAVTAGLSKPSSTRLLTDRLVSAVTEHVPAGTAVDVRVVELRDLAVDIANNLVSGWPSEALSGALDAVTGADGLIAVTPVFAGSYSGLFKSFFDLVEPDALTGTPVLLAATGGTARHSLVVEHAMRPLFSYLHALTLPTAVFAATDDWGAGADTYGGGLPARITRAGEEFAALVTPAGGDAVPHARRESAPGAGEGEGTGEGAEPEVVPFEQLLAGL
ncbi:FMN reductase [Streptomyces sp. NBC_01497]|uniref:FMN reductase n=1 Tax=Streptomyces sp. NBC_01497 TaxID=2903885 RepID=UPI002E30D9CE|nr:FMN reductase [Streptomyces sp. NBC_01497]